MTKHWTTADGQKLKPSEIEDSHLSNIIRDGYRVKFIVKEAKKRGMPVPEYEEPNLGALMMMVEATCSCAIEGIRSPVMDALVKKYEESDIMGAFKILRIINARNAFDNLTPKK